MILYLTNVLSQFNLPTNKQPIESEAFDVDHTTYAGRIAGSLRNFTRHVLRALRDTGSAARLSARNRSWAADYGCLPRRPLDHQTDLTFKHPHHLDHRINSGRNDYIWLFPVVELQYPLQTTPARLSVPPLEQKPLLTLDCCSVSGDQYGCFETLSLICLSVGF